MNMAGDFPKMCHGVATKIGKFLTCLFVAILGIQKLDRIVGEPFRWCRIPVPPVEKIHNYPEVFFELQI